MIISSNSRLKAERLIKSKRFVGLFVSENQIYQIARLYQAISEGNLKITLDTMSRNSKVFIESGLDSAYVERIRRKIKLGPISSTLYAYIIKYGKVRGLNEYQTYCNRQAFTNSYEYKNEVYGMSELDFIEYNKSRSQTKENMIKRYGDDVGLAKWNDYVKLQSYAGSSLEYYVDKYGVEKGNSIYENINLRKSHSIEGIMARGYSENDAMKILEIQSQKLCCGYSKISQELFWSIYNCLSEDDKRHCYFQELNQEFGKLDKLNKSYRKYDFVITHKKVCIEFNGNYYHADPKLYKSTESISHPGGVKRVRSIWDDDKIKKELIKSHGYSIMYVWEDDYASDPQRTVNNCLKYIEGCYAKI